MKRLLVVVDFQNDFIDGALGTPEAQAIVPNVVDKVKNAEKVGFGFDAYNEVYVDMMEAGIVDPVKVTRSAIQNAASIASTVLTTEAVVANQPEPEAPAAAAGGMGGMY